MLANDGRLLNLLRAEWTLLHHASPIVGTAAVIYNTNAEGMLAKNHGVFPVAEPHKRPQARDVGRSGAIGGRSRGVMVSLANLRQLGNAGPVRGPSHEGQYFS